MKGNGRADAGLLILRIGLGLVFLYFGSQKMFPIFGGKGYVATVNQFIESGIPPVFAHLAIVAEFFGGLGILLGLLTPVAAFGLACTMAVAAFKSVQPEGSFKALFTGGPTANPPGFFFPFALFFMAVALMVMGAGKHSLDGKYFRRSGR